jgi:hypothetical protein
MEHNVCNTCLRKNELLFRQKSVEDLWRKTRREKIMATPNFRNDAMLRFQLIDLTHEHKRISSQIAVLMEE